MGNNIRPTTVICLLLCLTFLGADAVRAGPKEFDSAPSSIQKLINSSLAVPSGHDVQQLLFAVGCQIYHYNGTNWNLANVSADLYNFKGVKVGDHFFLGEKDINGGQPSWETFHPASRVTAKAMTSVKQDQDSIDWVLLEATSHSGSLKTLASTTFIQRLYTQRGLAPAADLPARLGDVFESSYTAIYAFCTKQASKILIRTRELTASFPYGSAAGN